jgi:hypothetical protein
LDIVWQLFEHCLDLYRKRALATFVISFTLQARGPIQYGPEYNAEVAQLSVKQFSYKF